MFNLIARSVVFVFACLFAFGSPAGADTIPLTSGGLRGTLGPSSGFTFGLFDAAGPDFSADPAGVVIRNGCGLGDCVPGASATIALYTDIPYTSQATYQGTTYPIGPPTNQNAWFIDLQGTFVVPLITGDQTVALTVPMVIGGTFFLQGAQHTFTGSATAALILGLSPSQRWRTDSFAVTVDPLAVQPVPEPASMLLVGAGLGAAAWRKVRAGRRIATLKRGPSPES
jgi:PEP-CTERM motif